MTKLIDQKINIIIPALIIMLTFAAYMPAIQSGFIWDDDMYVTQNPLLTAPDGLWRIWATNDSPQYYPLVFTTFWIEHQIWGLNPMGYHIVNVALHVVNSLLIWLILHKLGVRWAWLAGAIFALHPVHVESVAWITERKNVLSGMFYLLSMVCYLRFKDEKGWKWYGGALLLFVPALLSKTVTASLPAALLLIHWLRRWRIGWRDLMLLVPFGVVGMGMGLMTAWYEVHFVGAQGMDWDFSIRQRFIIAGRALWFYANKLVWPAGLTFIYPRWHLNAHEPGQWLWLLGFVVVGLWLWFFRRKLGRGPLVGIAFFAVTLFPALGFFNIYPMRYSFVADHFQYLASIGLIGVFVSGAGWGLKWLQTNIIPDRRGLAEIIIGFMVMILLGTLTWRQGHIYTNLETLWQDTLAKNPDSWLAHNNLGIILAEQGKNNEAIEHYQEALRVSPADADTHYNLGNIMMRGGKIDKAIEHYQQTLRARPAEVKALNNLGNLLMKRGQYEDALKHYREALRLMPASWLAHNNMGIALREQGRLIEAIDHYQSALRIKPGYANASFNMGVALMDLNRFGEAIDVLRKGIALTPGHMRMANKLAWLLATSPSGDLRDGAKAVQLAQGVCKATGYKNPAAMDTLAAAYAETGRFEEAVQTSRQAIQRALSTDQSDLAKHIEARLKMYESHQAYRESASPFPLSTPLQGEGQGGDGVIFR